MVKITKAKDLNDEIKRENLLQKIEKVSTTKQLEKLVKLTKDKSMIALLDSFDI